GDRAGEGGGERKDDQARQGRRGRSRCRRLLPDGSHIRARGLRVAPLHYLPGNQFTYFWGFFAMAAILVVLGVLAGVIAAKVVKRSSPPVPSMAIDEARKIREAVSPGPSVADSAPRAVATPHPAPSGGEG